MDFPLAAMGDESWLENRSKVTDPYERDLRKESLLCYNRGCQMPDHNMGIRTTLPTKPSRKQRRLPDRTPRRPKKNTLELLQKALGQKKSRLASQSGS
jgi:hypothetical protein